MEQIKDEDDVVGKTVAAFHNDCDDRIWFGFSDGTFAIFGIERGYYDSAYLRLITDAPAPLDNTQAVLKLGIAKAEELRELSEAKQKASLAEHEKREKAELARLAAKYGGK